MNRSIAICAKIYSLFSFSSYLSFDTQGSTIKRKGQNELHSKRGLFFMLFHLFLFSNIGHAQSTFSTNETPNDAYIDLNWSLDKSTCIPGTTGEYPNGVIIEIRLDDNTTSTPIYSEALGNVTILENEIVGSYRHKVGPSASFTYYLKVRHNGNGNTLCSYDISGLTIPFQPPVIVEVSDFVYLDSIHLQWTNKSKLSDIFNIYRDSVLIDVIPGTSEIGVEVKYSDVYRFDDVTSLVNGAPPYEYCIETYSNITNQAYDQECDMGSTFDIGFTASDDNPIKKVELSWNSISSYSDKIYIERNNIRIATLSPDVESYIDQNPIYGKLSQYSLIPVKNNANLIEVKDMGSVPKNGMISGRVLTKTDLFPIGNVKLTLAGNVEGQVISEEVFTDYDGYFFFEDIYYEEEATFSLIATKPNRLFTEPEQSIDLNRVFPEVKDLIFLDENGFSSTNYTLDVSNFAATPALSKGNVKVAWNYTHLTSDTTFFNIYRGANLVGRLNDANGEVTSFTDLGGIPNKEYQYRMTAFRILESTEEVEAVFLSADAIFPCVAAPASLTATSNNILGVIELNWGDVHGSDTYTGFRIYRNGQFIDNIPTGIYDYTDLYAPVGEVSDYTIEVYRTLNDLNYKSEKIPTLPASATMQALPLALNSTALPKPNEDLVLLSWEVPAALIANYNYSGFNIYRKNSLATDFQLIGQKYKHFCPAGNTIEFEDLTGKPDTIYDYRISTWLETATGSYEASVDLNDIHFPAVKAPTGLTAFPIVGVVAFTWDQHSSTNIDGFTLFRDGNSVNVVTANNIFINDYLNTPSNTGEEFDNVVYELKSFRVINGEQFYSSPASIVSGPLAGFVDPILPTNFTASTNIANHVKLCWDYDNAVFSEFIIRRGAEILDTLPYTARTYYDYDAQSIQVYTIEAIYQNNNAQLVYTQGGLYFKNQIEGRVVKNISGIGVSGAQITASNSSGWYHAVTYTDSAGYYQFNEIPNIEGLTVDLTANAQNSDFSDGGSLDLTHSQIITTTAGQQTYQANFTDYYGPTIGGEVAELIKVVAFADPINMGVTLSWSPSNNNYTGFEINRGTSTIAEVMRGEEFVFLDELGTPGVVYTYAVRAFSDEGEERIYTKAKGARILYPLIAAPFNLSATPIPGFNRVTLRWSHPYDNNDFFRITRNGEFLAQVNVNEMSFFNDDTGFPGQLQEYSVVAILGDYESQAANVELTFPGVDEVQNLTAVIPYNSFLCSNGNTSSLPSNSVNLTFDYENNRADGFEIKRDGETLKVLASDERNFEDYTGIPGTGYTYEVVAFINREGAPISSGIDALVPSVIETCPYVVPFTFFQVDYTSSLSAVELSIEYSLEGVDGFNIFRRDLYNDEIIQLSTLYETTPLSETLVFTDETGEPGKEYVYTVQAISERNGNFIPTPYEGCGEVLLYPELPTPQNGDASNGTYFNYVDMSWEYPNDAGIDGFTLTNTITYEQYDIAPGKRTFKEIFSSIPSQVIQTYTLVSYKVVNGQTNFSAPYEFMGKPGIADEVAPKVFSQTYLNFGQAVAIDGNRAVVSIPPSGTDNETGHLYWYKQNNAGDWNSEGSQQPARAYDVDISGSKIIWGNPNVNLVAGSSGIAEIKDITGSTSGELSYTGDVTAKFGQSVSISGNYAVVAAPPSIVFPTPITPADFKLFIYHFDGENWDIQKTIVSPYPITFGYFVAITDNYCLISNPNGTGIDVYERSGTSWDKKNSITVSLLNTSAFGNNIDMTDDFAIAGNPNGPVTILENNGGTWGFKQILSHSPTNSFGNSVSITDGYAIVGAPHGKAHLFHQDGNGDWTEFEVINSPGSTIGFGLSVGISEHGYIIGAPNGNASEVYIYDLLDAPTNVQATDGTSGNNTSITWDYDPAYDKATAGFKIYRGNTELGTVAIGQTYYYEDTDGKKGKSYVYMVRAYNTGGAESLPDSDEGFTTADGMITGLVTTQGGSFVPGVDIIASGEVGGELYTDTVTTNSSGTYSFPNVYYGEDPSGVSYTLTPVYGDHIFNPSDETVTLSPTSKTASANFTDNTAYIVKGRIRHSNINCGIDSVYVEATYVTTNPPPFETKKSPLSNENGEYSFVVDLDKTGLVAILVEVEGFKTLTSGESAPPDTVFYNFTTNQPTSFTDFSNFQQETEINFTETTNYTVPLKVENACQDAIGDNTIFTIRARSIDGCYDSTFLTDGEGFVNAELPPLQLKLSVVDVSPSNQTTLTAINYFAGHPVTLDLHDIHWRLAPNLTLPEVENLTKRSFTYHKAPEISMSGLSKFFCNSPSNAAILTQQNDYTLNINVTEEFNGANCPVKEGFLKITNAAATETAPVFLEYDSSLPGFSPYTFKAGNPNVIDPHFYGINVEYLSKENAFLGSFIQPVFVEGSVATPGTDIVVDPSRNDQVQAPLFILRDPPGDHSYSTIETGASIEATITSEAENGGAVGAFVNTSVSAFGGFTLDVDATLGGSDTNSDEWGYTLTSTTTYSTSGDESFVGEKADVIVGIGMAMQYGLVQEFRAGACDTIYQTSKQGFAPFGVNTTWSFTVHDIESKIAEYRNDSLLVEAGTKTLIRGGKELDKKDALDLLDSYISNWKEILVYHSVKTLPHYLLCSEFKREDLSDNTSMVFPFPGLPISGDPLYEMLNTGIKDWQQEFCPLVGTYDVDDSFILNPAEDIVWDNDLIDMYNAAATSIRNLSKPLNNTIEYGDYLEDLFDPSKDLEDYFDSPYDNIFGKLAENKTFGGGTPQDFSFEAAQVSTRSYVSTFNFEANAKASVDFGVETSVITAPFGVGVINSVIQSENQFGGTVKYEHTTTNSRATAETNTVNMTYHLEDDEPGDQFSTTIIQGSAPNHTPYFYFFGGRASCPPETGGNGTTPILRDDPQFALYDASTNTTHNHLPRYNVPAHEAATYTVRMENNTPFPLDARSMYVFLNNSSNENGAVVKLNSTLLGDDVYCDIPAGESQTLTLTIERGLTSYVHENIEIVIGPWCSDPGTSCEGNGFPSGESQSIFVSAYFKSPCSPVTLVKPDDNWVVNSAENELIIGMRDYQPDNVNLEEIRMQYRRLGAGTSWDEIPLNQLAMNTPMTPTILGDFNSMLATSVIPEFPIVWTLPTDGYLTYPDGDYEIRAVADCGPDKTYSNVIPGKINRSGLLLFGTPEPADGIWSYGDEISIGFNKNLDCALIQNTAFIEQNITLINKSEGDEAVDFTMSCFDNELIFVLDAPMEEYDGDILEVMVTDVDGINGNGLLMPEVWDFQVTTQKLYFGTDTLRVFMYENEEKTFTVRIENSTIDNLPVPGVSVVDKTEPASSWLSWTDIEELPVPSLGTTIEFSLSGNTIGTFTETVMVDGLMGNIPELTIELTVLPKTPNWVLDTSNMDSTMVMIANWQFSNEVTAGIIQQDTMDRISVWIDGEIRGVAKVSKVGEFYAAYLTIYGNAIDEGKTMNFRIWDATEGIEYDGSPINTLLFDSNEIIGGIGQPELLVVDKDADIPRYIPLNEGWTWFSINTQETDMSLDHQLRSLSTESNGDIIKTSNRTAEYLDGSWTWLDPITALTTLDVNSGYEIYLANGPDTLRVTGSDATVSSISLNEDGWSWVGYPLQDILLINDVATITPSTTGNIIRTEQQSGNDLAASYDNATGNYEGTLEYLRPNDGYKVFNNSSSPAILFYGTNTFTENDPVFAYSITPADTEDPSTWSLSEYNFEFNMPLVAEVSLGALLVEDVNDKLGVFVGDEQSGYELRGVGNITHLASQDKYELSILVGSESMEEEFSLFFYDADTDVVYPVANTLIFEQLGYGTFTEPYLVEIQSFRSFVKTDGSDSNKGSSWAEAFQTIQKAVDVAKTGDEIWVASGTYFPTRDISGNIPGNTRDKTFFFDYDFKIYGGFEGIETDLNERDRLNNITILSGDFYQDDEGFVNNDENAFTVVYGQGLSNDFVIDGFHITGGNADDFGGGIGANVSGGGWYNDAIGGSSNPIITNCIFNYNEGTSGGAFSGFGSEEGISNPILTNCVFHHNLATGEGGAMYNWGANGESSPELLNCTFSENTAINSGGALFNNGNFGGISIPTITNSIFWGNTSPSGNSMAQSNGSANLTYTLLEESSCPIGMTCGMGMKYNQNPLLVDAVLGDLRLQSGSPALEAGINSAIPEELTEDLDSYDRITNGGVDLGAYERTDCYDSIIRIWSGVSDQYWDNAGNWNCGVPTLMHDVTIPNLGVQVILGIGKAGYCRSLTLEPGIIIDIKTGATLYVKYP
ncbi:MAG: hypothetical protein ACI86M_001411 [Saprospiraceae bacterium]|jgi:hypothetical protein